MRNSHSLIGYEIVCLQIIVHLLEDYYFVRIFVITFENISEPMCDVLFIYHKVFLFLNTNTNKNLIILIHVHILSIF